MKTIFGHGTAATRCAAAAARRGLASLLLCALVLCTACRKELCYTHDQHSESVKVEAAITWECEWERDYGHDWEHEWEADWHCRYDDLLPQAGEGVRVMVYREGGSYAEGNLSATGGRLPLQEGRQSILFYNNDTEYLVFNNLTAVVSASATTRTLTRSSFQAMHGEERTINQPDELYGHYEEDYWAEPTLLPVQLPVRMQPLVYTYLVRYEFAKGLQHVALARGALAGMAGCVYLKDGHTEDDVATILYDCTLQDYGAEAQVKTFGAPNCPGDHYTRADGSSARFSLNLEVRLKNGKMKTFEFDVTSQVLDQPRGGVIVVEGLEVTDEEGAAGSGGGFDTEVTDWGDYVDIPLPLN